MTSNRAGWTVIEAKIQRVPTKPPSIRILLQNFDAKFQSSPKRKFSVYFTHFKKECPVLNAKCLHLRKHQKSFQAEKTIQRRRLHKYRNLKRKLLFITFSCFSCYQYCVSGRKRRCFMTLSVASSTTRSVLLIADSNSFGSYASFA